MNDKNANFILAGWTGAWVLSMAVATFGPEFLWPGIAWLAWGGVLANTLIGLGMIWANFRLLQIMDELQRKIQLDAMAITLGLTLVVGLSYATLANIDAIPFDADIGFLVIFMALTYMAALFIGVRRYQ